MASYKRNIFIINPKFQFRISFFLCFLVFISTIFYPVTIYEIIESFIEATPSKAASLEETRTMLFLILGLVQVGVLGLIFVCTIFVSHKIAGPMYKLKNYLISIRNQEHFGPVFFRKGDYFPEIADELNETLSAISAKRSEDFAYLDEVNSYIANLSLVVPDDKKPVLEEIQRKILEIQNRYQ